MYCSFDSTPVLNELGLGISIYEGVPKNNLNFVKNPYIIFFTKQLAP